MKIKDLKEEHPAIYSRIKEIYKEQMRSFNDNVNLADRISEGGFFWTDTLEGYDFWNDIDDGNFQVFYDRYPEHAKDPVKFSIEEKDWSKATDEELIAEAKRRYPIGTVCRRISRKETFTILTDDHYSGDKRIYVGSIDALEWFDKDGHYLSSNPHLYLQGVWAEIVSQPEQETRTSWMDNDITEPCGPPEPKGGDMVEAADLKDFSVAVVGYFTGGKDKRGRYICEVNELGELFAYNFIRLPQKSEVESKAKELLVKNGWEDDFIYNEELKEMLIEAMKWAQQNPTKK